MKKVAIIGANGKTGANLVREALAKGHNVTGFVRNKEYKNEQISVVYKDVFELTKADLNGFDAVISGFAVWTPQTFELHAKHTKHLADLLSGTKTRLFIVGGAGTLFVDPQKTLMLMDAPDFPAEYQGVARADAASFYELKSRNDVRYTYVSPAAQYDANGARSGKFALSADSLILNSKGQSYISYADLALAIIDELDNENFVQSSMTAVGE